MVVVATFYKFFPFPDYADVQPSWLAYCQSQGIRGTILLAREGINGTIAGSRTAIDAVLAHLRSDPRLADLGHRESVCDAPPFDRLKVKLKREIVTLGLPEVDPNQGTGVHVHPRDWNALLTDPEVTVIDTRNAYEVDIGSFQGAINPQTDSFRQFPEYVQQHLDPQHTRKIAMFCTGGIRCEKASAYLLQQGFEQVYQLQGGILNYLETVPEAESLWRGECFVFDQRTAIQHGLAVGTHVMCQACGYPLSESDRTSPHYQPGHSCPHCWDVSDEKVESVVMQ